MNYRAKTTSTARADRDRCFDYIDEQSPEGALRWLEAYESAVELLCANPHHGFAPENEDHGEEIRQCFFKTAHGLVYRMLFLIRDDAIWILHVRGSGQDIMAPDELEIPKSE